ncbi:50S ribosomal protein L15 [Patescibacteria group bacterium]|nr:MAG: 50S ribosomal protein L15 [Patescibacteria group bacterium]
MSYTLHTIAAAPGSRRKKKRLGRGNASGHGTYSTRGMKGQRARSGGRRGLKKKGMKRLLASLPKIGGFRSLKIKPESVTLAALAGHFRDGEEVTLNALKRRGLVSARARGAKIIGGAELKKKLIVRGLAASAGAKSAIEGAGGTVG